MQQKSKITKEDEDTQNVLKELESRKQSLSEASQWNRKHKKKSCAHQNVSFMKHIRDYKMSLKLKTWVK